MREPRKLPYPVRGDRIGPATARRWEFASDRNLAMLGQIMVGVPFPVIGERFGMTPKRAQGIAHHYSVVRFKRVDVSRVKRRNHPEFWDNVAKGEGCWDWQGVRDPSGYGYFYGVRAHRRSLEESLGRKLRDDEQACHRCDNPSCVRPDHLYAGSAFDNAKDRVARGRDNHREPDGVTPLKFKRWGS